MASDCYPGFSRTGNSDIRSIDPRKPHPRTKHEVDRHRITRCGDLTIRSSTYHEWCIWCPRFEGRGCRRGSYSSVVPLEKTMVISYTLLIVTIELSLTTRPQFAIEYDRGRRIYDVQFNRGWFTLCQNFKVFPLEQTRDVLVCGERTPQAN